MGAEEDLLTLRDIEEMVTRLVLADDHPFVRVGIRTILEKSPDIIVVGEAGDGLQALHLTDALEPDVLLLDMEMPGLKGIEVAQKLREGGSSVPILALSAHEDKQYILGMLAHGAAGYLVKEEIPEMIIKAVLGVSQGERGWISRRVAARIGIWMQGEKPGHINLSEQDIKMLRLVVAGKKNEEIGATLGISETLVESNLETAVHAVRESLEKE